MRYNSNCGCPFGINAVLVVDCRSPLTALLPECAGTRFAGDKVVFACGPWAQPVLRDICGLHLPLQVWQTTVMYFKGLEREAGSTSGRKALENLPVVIDYGHVPLWTSCGKSRAILLDHTDSGLGFPYAVNVWE